MTLHRQPAGPFGTGARSSSQFADRRQSHYGKWARVMLEPFYYLAIRQQLFYVVERLCIAELSVVDMSLNAGKRETGKGKRKQGPVIPHSS